MPLTGNRLGEKEKFVYISDDPSIGYIISRDTDLAIAGTGAGGGSPDIYDPASPPTGITVCPAPRRFAPRCVFVEDPVSGARKPMTCFSPTSSLYVSSVGQTVTIDGLEFVSTGRKGEKLTF